MKIKEIILEAKPQNLGQGMLDKLFAVYQQRDINDATLPQKFESGAQVADLIYQNIGPSYLIWAAKQYTVDKYFFLHDLPEWKQTLDQFNVLSKDRRIELEKDINKYQSIDRLRTALEQASGAKEHLGSKFYSTAISAIDKFVKQGQASWLYRSNEYSIYYPKTFESSNVCSKLMSTNVCTIMNKEHFDSYSDKGTLMYIITQDKLFNCYISKYSSGKSSEFADEKNNHDFDLAWQLQHFTKLRPLIKKVMTPRTELEVQLAVANSEQEKYDIYLATVVNTSGEALKHVPNEFMDYAFCVAAVQANGEVLKYVPKEFMDYDMCLAAVQANAWGLLYVPKEFMDYDMCLAAVQTGTKLGAVPKEFKDYDMCLAAVQTGSNLRDVPKEFRDYALCLVAVKQAGINLHEVPKEFKDYDMFLAAVQANGSALRYVPDKFKAAVQANARPAESEFDSDVDRVKELTERLLR
jgi:hypothetical protein